MDPPTLHYLHPAKKTAFNVRYQLKAHPQQLPFLKYHPITPLEVCRSTTEVVVVFIDLCKYIQNLYKQEDMFN